MFKKKPKLIIVEDEYTKVNSNKWLSQRSLDIDGYKVSVQTDNIFSGDAQADMFLKGVEQAFKSMGEDYIVKVLTTRITEYSK